MKDFLEKYPLYKKFQLEENYDIQSTNEFYAPHKFNDQTFQYYCEKDEDIRTHKIIIHDSIYEHYGNHLNEDQQRNFMTDGKLDFVLNAKCQCLSCGSEKLNFFLHLFSDNIIPIKKFAGSPPSNGSFLNVEEITVKSLEKSTPISIYIEKVGANPKIKPKIDRSIVKYFDRESNKWYYKGIECIKNSFGIGSLAYFRRIVEKDLLKIVRDIENLPDANSEGIKNLLEKYKKGGKVSAIYENIFQYLPHSLRSLGDNPMKLLYKQTSEGLHSLSEEECLKKSEYILELLNFVIKKINEEQSVLSNLRKTIKQLNS